MKILFVCTANVDRSRTAENHFALTYPTWLFKSAGTSSIHCEEANSTVITQDLINWADFVICMEEKHAVHISQNFNTESPVYALNINDNYTYNSPELIQILESKVLPLFQSKLQSK